MYVRKTSELNKYVEKRQNIYEMCMYKRKHETKNFRKICTFELNSLGSFRKIFVSKTFYLKLWKY